MKRSHGGRSGPGGGPHRLVDGNVQFFTVRVLPYLIPGLATGIAALVALLSASHITVPLAGLTILLVALGFAGPPIVDGLRSRGAPQRAQAELAVRRRQEQADLRAAQLRDHFEPRGRGILPTQMRDGSYFTGRVRILGELSSWLSPDAADCRARVVTGGPGSGKSAVLGRLVGLADPQLRSKWMRSGAADVQPQTVPPPGVTIIGVHARGRTADEVAAQIAYGLDIDETNAVGLIAALRSSWQPRPTVVAVAVDAVDEAADPYRLIRELLEPVASAAGRTRIRLLVGTRRGGGDDLLLLFGASAVILDLDTPEYLDISDVEDYVRRTLLAESDPQTATPYRGQPALAVTVAHAVAARAEPSFLVAQLTALSLTGALQPVDTTAPGWMEALPTTVSAAMEDYLRNARPPGRWLQDLLTALAWSYGDGLDDLQLWAAVASEIGTAEYSEHDVLQLLDSSAADLLLRTDHGGQFAYRLFHEALGEHLRLHSSTLRPATETQRRFTDVLTAHVPRSDAGTPDWSRASHYTRMYLPLHAAQGHVLDSLLEDAGFLATAEPARLLAALPAVTTDRGRLIVRIVERVGQQLLQAAPGEQVCYLEMAARMAADDRLAADLASFAPKRPWSVPWAHWDTLSDGRLLGHHDGWVLAVSTVDTPHDTMVVSASAWAIRAWWLGDGTPTASGMREAPSPITDMVAFRLADEVAVVTLHHDGELRRTILGGSAPPQTLARDRAVLQGIWLITCADQPAIVTVRQNQVVEVLLAADGQPADLASVSLAGSQILAAGNTSGRCLLVTATEGEERTTQQVVTWDMSTGNPVGRALRPTEVFPDRDQHFAIWTADVTESDGRPIVLIGASARGPVALWDPVCGELIGEPYYVDAGVFQVRNISTRDGDLLCWGASDGNLYLRSGVAGDLRRLAAHDSGIQAITGCRSGGDTVMVTGGRDGAVRVWRPGDAQPAGPSRICHGLVAMSSADRDQSLVASISAVGAGQVIDAADGRILAELAPSEGAEHRCIALLPGRTPAVVTADSANQIAVWRPPDRQPAQRWQLHAESRPDTISVAGGDRPVLLASLPDGRLAFLDLTTGQQARTPLTCHKSSFIVVADPEQQSDGALRFMTAIGDAPQQARLWTLTAGEVASHDLAMEDEPGLDHPAGIAALSFGRLHHHRIAAGVGEYSCLYVWDADNGQRLAHAQLKQAYQMMLADVDVGEVARRTVILSGGYTCSLVLWTLDTHEERHLWVGSPLAFIKSLPEDRAVVAGPRGIIVFQLTRACLANDPAN